MEFRTIRKNSAFSLVELVACVAIVAILASMTASMMNSFHNRALAAQSQSNLRQLAAANLLYAADHAGAFCPAEDAATGNVRWHGGRRNASESFDPTLGYLGEYLQSSVTDCPLFRPTNESLVMGVGGYGYNAAYIGCHSSADAGADSGKVFEKTVMFTTTASKQASGLGEAAVCEPYFQVNSNGKETLVLSDPTVHFRVNGRALVAWTDGSVSALPPKNLAKNLPWGSETDPMLGWFGPHENNGLWNPNWIQQFVASGGTPDWEYEYSGQYEDVLVASIYANQTSSTEGSSPSTGPVVPTNNFFLD